MQILGDVVPGLVARRQEEERRARVAQRLHKQMGAVLLDPEGGYGRCALHGERLRAPAVLCWRFLTAPCHLPSVWKSSSVMSECWAVQREAPWPGGHACRARRARKAVDYSGNAYDDIIRSAIRSQADRGRDPCSRRGAAALEPMCARLAHGCS